MKSKHCQIAELAPQETAEKSNLFPVKERCLDHLVDCHGTSMSRVLTEPAAVSSQDIYL